MKVTVIDHSSSIIMYDHCLCEALVANGCEVLYIGTNYLYTKFNQQRNYQCLYHFYHRTNLLLRKVKLSIKFRKVLRGIEYLFDMVSLLKRLRQLKPDIIHFETLPMPIVDMWFLSCFKKLTKIVLTVHDTSHRNESRIQFWGFVKCLRLFDHLIVLTSFSKDQVIRKAGISSNKIDIIPHGVFQCYQKEVNSPLKNMDAQEDKIILFFGVIKDYKGLDLLIASLAKLSEELLQKSRLLVAGYPFIDIEPLRRLATELGVLNKITWDLRFIPEDEVSSYFEAATVIVFPYREIDQSGAMHIALAFSKPIVATKVGGFPEILQDGVHGYLVEPDDPLGLAIALNRILTDPARIHKMSLAVRNLADTLSWDMVARKTIHIYKKVCNPYEMEV